MPCKLCDDFNPRYRTYNKFADSADDFVKIGTTFAKFVNKKSKTDLGATGIITPAELMERVKNRFEEFRSVIKT